MDKRIIFLLIFLLMIPCVCAWSIFDEPIEEHTDHIYIEDIETEWANYSNGYYGYNVNFRLYNISSSHEIQAVISFYDSENNIIEDENLSGGGKEPILQGEVQDNLTIVLEEYEKSYITSNPYLYGGIDRFDYCEVDHIKIDVFDASENKLLYSINQTFNMSNLWDPSEVSQELEESDDDYNSKSDDDYDFFEETDWDGDGVISFEEFTDISYIFTEDSFWDGYSTEEIIQNEWDRANSDGDDYLTFEEFRKVI